MLYFENYSVCTKNHCVKTIDSLNVCKTCLYTEGDGMLDGLSPQFPHDQRSRWPCWSCWWLNKALSFLKKKRIMLNSCGHVAVGPLRDSCGLLVYTNLIVSFIYRILFQQEYLCIFSPLGAHNVSYLYLVPPHACMTKIKQTLSLSSPT